jgi:ribonuclease D
MTHQTISPAIYIKRKAALWRLVDELSREKIIAVDTESNSLYAYREQVCLIQFSTPAQDYILDPLAFQNLDVLEEIFRNPEIEKVFHTAEYDLLCLNRDFGFEFQSLYDTMIAAGILGWERLGLGSVLEEQFGITVNKKNQRANWGRRPLPAELLEYAQLDTHFLIKLRNRQQQALIEKGLWPLAKEDFERLALIVPEQTKEWSQPDRQNSFWRINGACTLDPEKATVLKEVFLYREKAAERLNRPPFKVLSNKSLLEIADQLPGNQSALHEISGITSRVIKSHGDGILTAVRKGITSDPVYPPVRKRPSSQYLRRKDQLKQWRKRMARKKGVKSDVILPKDLLEAIARQSPSNLGELGEIMADVPWRFSRYGKSILSSLPQSSSLT